MGKQVTDYLLYKWRYILGYSLIGLIVIAMFVVAGLYIPGGLSHAEMDSAITSSALTFSLDSFHPSMIVNLPYQLLQRGSFELFGVSPISIKLPSLILGLFSALGMLLLLRKWFPSNIAVITTVLVITTGQFLFMAQSGTPSIVYLFWPVWLLVAAMMISRGARAPLFWKVLLFVLAALSLYTPLSLYILLALMSATILHPHLRYLIRQLPKPELMFAAFCALIIVVPLGYIVFRHPPVGLTLLGIPIDPPNLWANGIKLIKQYFDFITPSTGVVMQPVYGLGSMILIVLGVIRLATTKYTARGYIITAWGILLIPILLLNPNYISVTFVPVVLLMAMGIHWLLAQWYRLFPRNPYARLAGLVPLAVLIGGMVFSGLDRYMYGYLYSPQTAVNFSKDLQLLNRQLAMPDRGTTALVVSESETPFYKVVAHYNKNLTVATNTNTQPNTATTIMSRAVHIPGSTMPFEIITGDTAQNADRFYIYKTGQ